MKSIWTTNHAQQQKNGWKHECILCLTLCHSLHMIIFGVRPRILRDILAYFIGHRVSSHQLMAAEQRVMRDEGGGEFQ